jgi:hypothetical protein
MGLLESKNMVVGNLKILVERLEMELRKYSRK